MLRYEVLILTIPEITQDETKDLETQLTGVINKAKANVISFERWGKYALAYPVEKNSYGVYFLVRFEVAGKSTALIEEIQRLCAVKFDSLVMRSMVSVLNPLGSLAYQRQHSLEEATTRDIAVGNPKEEREGFYDNRSRERMSRDNDYQQLGHDEGRA